MNRLWLRSFALLLCLVQFIAVSKVCQAENPAAGEKLLPKDTLIFFTTPNVVELKAKWDKSSLGQLLHEPKMKPFLDDVRKNIEEWSKAREEDLGLSLGNLLELPQSDMTFAVMERPKAKIAIVTILDFGDRQSNVEKLLKEMDEALEKQEFEHTTEEIEKVTVHVYTHKNDRADNPFNTIAYFTDKSNLVFSTELVAVKEVLERWDGNSDDTLADNEQYKYIQTQCKTESGEPLVKMFVNPIGLVNSGISMAQSTMPQAMMLSGIIPITGIDALKGWGGASDFDEGDFEWVSNSFIYAEKPKGVLGIFNFPASQLVPPKWVPANIGSYFVTNWDLQGAYKSVESLFDMVKGPGATARLLDSLADTGPMIHPKKDLIDHMDGKIHFMQGEAKEVKDSDDDATVVPGFFLGLGLKDAAKMKKTLAAAAKAGGSNLETREFNGETIYEANQPGNEQVMSFAVTEGALVLTNDSQLLEAMMRGEAGRGLALVDSPDYKKIAKLFPSSLSMLSFQRSDIQMKMYYDLAKNAGSEGIDGLDFSKLPPFDVIAKYLVPSGSYIVPDKRGAKTVSFSLKRAD